MHQPDDDAEPVQAAGGDDEPDAVTEAVLSGRQLGSMRMAVEDRKRGDKRHRRRQLRLRFKHHR